MIIGTASHANLPDANMPLSDLTIRNAKPATRVAKLSDGGGLQLQVFPNGSKLWRLAYRFDGKQKQLALGAYPLIGLQAARSKREQAKRLLAEGVDPMEQKRLDRITAASQAATTFGLLADELIARKTQEGRAAATVEKTRWLLDFAVPLLGRRPISEISSAEVLAVLRTVESRGRFESAHRLRAVIGEVFRFAIATARAANDPTVALRGSLLSPRIAHRAAILDPVALGGLLRAIDSFEGQPVTKAALQLMAVLFPRPGELRAAEWSEIDFGAAVWTIPAARTKMRRVHQVPLPRQALVILKDLHALTGRGVGGLLFPGIRTVTRPISDNTLNASLRRLGFTKTEHSAHGFRATASTLLNESGRFSSDAIERALGHIDVNRVRRAYARGAHWEERVRIAQWWADQLDAWRDGAKITSLRNSGRDPG